MNKNNLTWRDIVRACKVYRQCVLNVTQSVVAHDTMYDYGNISQFENGRNHNGELLLWYFKHGFTLEWAIEYINSLNV